MNDGQWAQLTGSGTLSQSKLDRLFACDEPHSSKLFSHFQLTVLIDMSSVLLFSFHEPIITQSVRVTSAPGDDPRDFLGGIVILTSDPPTLFGQIVFHVLVNPVT